MKALVTGASGFLGGHLVKRLKGEGYWVRGVDIRSPEYADDFADEFVVADLRERESCDRALSAAGDFDEVYQLAADMGGMGFIQAAETDIMRNNVLINVNMTDAAASHGVRRYFFSSSVCVYRDMAPGEPELAEDNAYPALPDNEYGWEKLYAERVALAYGRRSAMAVRIARLQNCYGPLGAWRGGREKAPAAICRKVAEARAGDAIEVWGDGSAVRCFTYVDDVVDGIHRLMHSDLDGPVNIGSSEYVTVDQLAATVIDVAEKQVEVVHVDGPVGVRSRNFSTARIASTGWRARHDLRAGIERTYPWVAAQVAQARTPRP